MTNIDTSWLDMSMGEEDSGLDTGTDSPALSSSSLRIKERVNSIAICSMYVDRDSCLIHTSTDLSVPLDASDMADTAVWPQAQMQAFVRDKQTIGSRNFYVENVLLYHVHLLPEQVQMYAKTDTDVLDVKRFLKKVRYTAGGDILIPPAVSAFQDVHRIYIVFREQLSQEYEAVGFGDDVASPPTTDVVRNTEGVHSSLVGEHRKDRIRRYTRKFKRALKTSIRPKILRVGEATGNPQSGF